MATVTTIVGILLVWLVKVVLTSPSILLLIHVLQWLPRHVVVTLLQELATEVARTIITNVAMVLMWLTHTAAGYLPNMIWKIVEKLRYDDKTETEGYALTIYKEAQEMSTALVAAPEWHEATEMAETVLTMNEQSCAVAIGLFLLFWVVLKEVRSLLKKLFDRLFPEKVVVQEATPWTIRQWQKAYRLLEKGIRQKQERELKRAAQATMSAEASTTPVRRSQPKQAARPINENETKVRALYKQLGEPALSGRSLTQWAIDHLGQMVIRWGTTYRGKTFEMTHTIKPDYGKWLSSQPELLKSNPEMKVFVLYSELVAQKKTMDNLGMAAEILTQSDSSGPLASTDPASQ